MNAPFMQLYVGDYLKDTRHLTAEQHGAYLLLLMSMWAHGGDLPNDPKKLARLACCTASRWARISADVLAFFEVDGDVITQARLRFELKKALEKSIKRAEAGTRGGDAKALKDKKAGVANAIGLPCHSSEPEPEGKKEKAAPSPKKGTRLSADWLPSLDDEAFALKHLTREEYAHEADQFRDFWIAKPGAGGVKLDWPATWRGWVRRSATSPRVAGRAEAGHRGRQASDVSAEVARRRREREQGMEVPGRRGAVSGSDHGWSEGAIEGELFRGPGES